MTLKDSGRVESESGWVNQAHANEERRTLVNSSGNKHAYEVGKAIQGLTLNDFERLAQLKVSRGGLTRVTRVMQMKKKERQSILVGINMHMR